MGRERRQNERETHIERYTADTKKETQTLMEEGENDKDIRLR